MNVYHGGYLYKYILNIFVLFVCSVCFWFFFCSFIDLPFPFFEDPSPPPFTFFRAGCSVLGLFVDVVILLGGSDLFVGGLSFFMDLLVSAIKFSIAPSISFPILGKLETNSEIIKWLA